MKTLYLMRHGETMFNAQHRIQGWCDSPLTGRGIEQARAMGAKLRERGVRVDRARMVETLTDIMLKPGGDSVLAVGHGGANFNFLRAIQDPMPVLNAGWANCTTCVYAFDEARADEAPDGRGAGPWRLLDVVRLQETTLSPSGSCKV